METKRQGYEILISEEQYVFTKILTGYKRHVIDIKFGIPKEWKLDFDALDQVQCEWVLITEDVQDLNPKIKPNLSKRGAELHSTIKRRILWIEKEEDATLYKLVAT